MLLNQIRLVPNIEWNRFCFCFFLLTTGQRVAFVDLIFGSFRPLPIAHYFCNNLYIVAWRKTNSSFRFCSLKVIAEK